MDKVLIVDGHSVIFSTDELRKIHAVNGRQARGELVKILTEHQDMNEVSVVLVFDGKGERNTPEVRQDKDIMVLYSRTGQSADGVIERLAAKYTADYDISVVSNDRSVLDVISSYGAHPMSVRSMWEVV